MLEEYEYSHLIEHNSEICKHCEEKPYEDCSNVNCSICVMDKAKEIVNQLAEEHNNGWIPCSERMPEKYGEHIVMIEGAILPTCLMYSSRTQKWYGIEGDELTYYPVIAWQPLPQPFSPTLVQDSPSLVQDWKDSMLNTFDGREV